MFYVHPAIAEGCSSFSNYMAMEVSAPIACANTTSHPEALGNAALFFDPLNIESIRQGILAIWKDEAMRARLAEAGRIRIMHFTWEKNASIVADTFLRRLSLS
jgi:alpha-1,3-rhamnosyl/mannosyltransferase